MNQAFCAIKEYVPLGLCRREENGSELITATADKEHDFAHGRERFMKEAAILLEVADILDKLVLLD